MVDIPTRVQQQEWILSDLNAHVIASVVTIKRVFNGFDTTSWDNEAIGRITQGLEMRDQRPVIFPADGFNLVFYGVNQIRNLEFVQGEFVWREREPKLVIDDRRVPQRFRPHFDHTFERLSYLLAIKHRLTVQNFPKSLIFPTDDYSWGSIELENTVPLSALIRNRK